MITVIFVPNENWKHIGIVRHNSSPSGQDIRGVSPTSSTKIQHENILETVDKEMSNLYPSGLD